MKKGISLTLLVLAAFAAGIGVDRILIRGEAVDEKEPKRKSLVSLVPLGTAASGEASLSAGRDGGGADARQDRRGRRDQSGSGSKPDLTALLALSGEDAMHDALGGTSASEVAVLLQELEASGRDSREATTLKRALYQRWAHSDPRAALAKVLQEKNARLKMDVLHTAFAELARKDVREATAAFLDLQTFRQRQEAVEAMGHHVDVSAFPELATFLADHAPGLEVEGLYHQWAERDPGSEALLVSASKQGPQALRAVARGWARRDPAAALDWARGIDGQIPGTRAVASAVEALIDGDPRQAAAWVDQMPPGSQREDVTREIARGWAREDLQAALAWTKTLDSSAQRTAMQGLAHEWALQDPQGAAAFAESLPPSEQRRDSLAEVAHLWARENVGEALDWASSLPGRDSVGALRGVMETVAGQSPEAAADLITQLSGALSSDAYREITGDVAGRWTEFDPAAAADWARTLPAEGEIQRHAVERIADRWIGQDPLAASEWIGTLPPGRVRDAATERLVDQVASQDPAAAYQWALTASEVDHQTGMLEHVFEQWRNLDRQAAETTFQTAPVNEEQRRHLNRIFQPEAGAAP